MEDNSYRDEVEYAAPSAERLRRERQAYEQAEREGKHE